MRASNLLTGALLLVSTVSHARASAADTHPFTVQDLLAMDRIGDSRPSPDGRRVVFEVSVTDLAENRRRSDLWLVNIDGGGLRRLTTDPADDGSPAWAPDGRTVWFISERSGTHQVWRVPIDGGEAEQMTRQPLDVDSFALAPDGSSLVFSMAVFPDCDTVACTKKRLDDLAARKETGEVYERLFIRHWDQWADGRRSHLFSSPVGAPSGGREPVDLMKGMDADTPSRPFGSAEEYAFTPDGRAVVFSTRNAGREESWSTNFDLYLSPLDGSKPPKNLTEANPAWDTHPSFSPDGRTLAYLAMTRPGYESDRYHIMLRSWPDGNTRELVADWDHSPDALIWAPDGRTLYATADHLGQKPLFAIDVSSGRVRTLIPEGHVTAPAVAGNRLVVGIDQLRSPAELYTLKPNGSGLARLTRINDTRVAATRMGEPEQFSFAGWNGETVHGYVVKPADFDPAKRYPVAFLIHGGPQGSFGNDFHYRWNPQVYTGAGYAAIMIDFHGSTGYGQAFTDAIRGDWGGKPLEDLQKGLAAALERYTWLDGDRVCALGASYGGYMINWIAGKWPDRFRCLVAHDGNLDERMAYYDTEELWFPEWDHQGTPWDNPDGYARHNPIDHVKNWKTPMLVIHGGKDFRVVSTQGMSTFTALQRLGIPSRFLYFPDENHWVLKPLNSLQWHRTVLEWLDRWTGPGAPAARSTH